MRCFYASSEGCVFDRSVVKLKKEDKRIKNHLWKPELFGLKQDDN